ncbi:MAG: hypothetical protein J7J87_01750 [Candidatus Diapherotrites archaeon]|nr:hypothetical protein [Candidatus Diapherotrites archaeon]
MGLNSIVAAAKATKTVQREIAYKKPKPKFIDADELSEDMQQKQLQNENWKTCKYLKEQNGCFFCTYFISKCAKEKCNQKYIKKE